MFVFVQQLCRLVLEVDYGFCLKIHLFSFFLQVLYQKGYSAGSVYYSFCFLAVCPGSVWSDGGNLKADGQPSVYSLAG